MKSLKDLWSIATEALEEVKKNRKLNQLQLQGELDIVESAQEVANAEAHLDKIIQDQKTAEKPSFKAITNANCAVSIATKKHEMAVKDFKEFFGENPKYSS